MAVAVTLPFAAACFSDRRGAAFTQWEPLSVADEMLAERGIGHCGPEKCVEGMIRIHGETCGRNLQTQECPRWEGCVQRRIEGLKLFR